MVGLGDERRPQALVHAPLAVVPVPFPRRSFEQAYAAAPVFNALVDAVARDGAYLRATLRPAAEFDDFTVSHGRPIHACESLRSRYALRECHSGCEQESGRCAPEQLACMQGSLSSTA